ncbi:MAG: hypothetical protein GY925_27880 [Actinomycetia bacterium]|nr:hypothetical protein [Actinomycetes bacterium]
MLGGSGCWAVLVDEPAAHGAALDRSVQFDDGGGFGVVGRLLVQTAMWAMNLTPDSGVL